MTCPRSYRKLAELQGETKSSDTYFQAYSNSLWFCVCACLCLCMSVLKLHASLAVHVALKVQDSTNYNLVSEGCESHSVVSNSLWPHGLYNPWNSPGQNTGVGSHSLLQGNLPNPGIKPRSPALQANSLPAEPPGKPWSSVHKGNGSADLEESMFRPQEACRCLNVCVPSNS